MKSKWRKRCLVLLTLVGTGTVVLFLLRNQVVGPSVVALARRWLGEGATLTVERWSGSWLGSLSLDGVAFSSGPDGPPLRELRRARVSARYSITGLLRGDLAGIEDLSFEADRLALVLEEGGTTDPEEERPASAFGAPPALPPVEGRIGTLDLLLPGGEHLTVRDAELRLAPAPEADAVQLSVRGATLDGTELPPLTLRASYRDGRIRIDELTAQELSLRDGSLDLGTTDDEPLLTWDLPLQYRGSRARISGSLLGERASLRIQEGELDLADLPFALPASGTLTIAGAADLPTPSPLDAEAEFTVSGRGLRYGDSVVELVEGEVRYRERGLEVPELLVQSGLNRLSTTGVMLPVDADPLVLLRQGAGRIVVTIDDVTSLLAAAGRPPESPLPSHHAELEIVATDGRFAVERGRVVTAGGTFVVRTASLTLPEGARSVDEVVLESDWSLAFEDVGEFFRLVGQDDWRGGLVGSLTAAGPLQAVRGSIDVEARQLGWRDHEIGLARVRAALDEREVRLEELAVESSDGTVEAKGTWERSTGRLAGVELAARLTSLDGLGLQAVAGGPVRLDLDLDGDPLAPTGDARLEAEDLVLAGNEVSSLRVLAEAREGRIDLKELRAGTPEVELAASGSVEVSAPSPDSGERTLEATLSTLQLDHEQGRLSLSQEATLVLRGDRLEVTPLELAGDQGSARIEVTRTGEALEAEVVFRDFLPATLLASVAPRAVEAGLRVGRADGTAQVHLGTESPSIDVDLSVEEVVPAAGFPAWNVTARLRAAAGLLAIETVEATCADGGRVTATGRLPFDAFADDPFLPGDLVAGLDVSLPHLVPPPDLLPITFEGTGAVELTARFGGTWKQVEGRLEAAAQNVRLVDDEGRDLLPESADVTLQGRLGDRLELTVGEARLPVGRIRARGSVASPLDLTRNDLDSLLDAALDARVDLVLDEISWAARRVESIRRLDGSLRGGLEVTGSLRTPVPRGDLSWSEGEMRLAASLPLLTGVRSLVRVSGETIVLEDLSGEWGGSPFQASGSLAFPADGEPGRGPEIELAVFGEDLLLYRGGRTKLRANARLRVEGPLEALRTSGDLVLTDARVGERIDLFSGLRPGNDRPRTSERGMVLSFWREPPLKDMQFDLRITCEQPFAIKNNLVNGGLRPDIRLRGDGEVPLILGNVFLEPTRISLPSGRLLVNGGLIRFVTEDPFVPRLDFTGELRVKGYDIQAVITGAYDQPEIELSSVPPLPNDDLLVLFLTGQLPQGTTGDRGRAAAETVAVYLTQDLLLNLLSDGEDDGDSLFDQFEFHVGQDLTRSGAPTAEAYFYVVDRPRGPGRSPYLRAERDIYDKINMGVGLLFRFE